MTITVVTKDLAGLEDIFFGENSRTQIRGAQSVTITDVNVIKVVDTVAKLRLETTTTQGNFFRAIQTLGNLSKRDGGGALWQLDENRPQTDDNGRTIIAVLGTTVGCWLMTNPPLWTFRTTGIGTFTRGGYTFTVTSPSTGVFQVTHNVGTTLHVTALLANNPTPGTVSMTVFNATLNYFEVYDLAGSPLAGFLQLTFSFEQPL